MRVIALACVVTAFAHVAQARDVSLTLDWPLEAAPATELVAVARDASGVVLDTQRLALAAGTSEAVLPLPGLSRQASTVQVGALVEGAFALQSVRALVEGGQAPERMHLTAVLTASFSADYQCNSGAEISLVPDGNGVRLSGQRFAPGDLAGRFIASDGTTLNRAPGLVQLESAEGTLEDTCQPIPARPVLPLTAVGPDGAWQLRSGTGGSVLQVAPADPDAAPPEPVATTISRAADDAFLFTLGSQTLLLRRAACQLPGLDMPFPFTAELSAPEARFAQGCAGDPLRALEGAPWQVTRLFGQAVPRGADGASSFALQVDTGRLSGRTSCNRFLGRAAVIDGQMTVSELGTTRLACPVNLSNLEVRFLDALEAADGIVRLPGGQVALYAGATAVLVLRRAG
jgi:heat shock protein HslJ